MMLQYERTNAVVSLTLIGLALYFVLEFPRQSLSLTIEGQFFQIDAPQRWLMALLLVGLTMAGTDMVIRSHPALLEYRLGYLSTFWMLPGLLVAVATQVLNLAPTLFVWGGALLGVGAILWLTIVTEFQQVSAQSQPRRFAFIWQQFMGYALALTLMFLIYRAGGHNLITALLVLLISCMIALSLLRQKPSAISVTWLFALTIGISLGQITWVLRYWQTTTLQASLVLFLIFYVFTGLTQQHLADKLSRRTLWAFGVVTLVGLFVIYNL